MLKRKIDIILQKWYESRKNALLIKGARQIGKTYSIKNFLKSTNNNYVEINFADDADILEALASVNSVDQFLIRLSSLYGEKMKDENTIFFFDEIQVLYEYRENLKKEGKLCNNTVDILTLIKPLVINGKYRFILSGSLLGVSIKDIVLFPLGYLDEINMYPLDFEEYLWANNVDATTIEYLKDCFLNMKPVDEFVNKRIKELFREYTLIGGMPEAVSSFIDKKNLFDVDFAKKQIVERYTYDITRYISDSSKKLRVKEIFKAIPSEINAKNKRFVSSHVIDSNFLKRNSLDDEFIWLTNAGIAIPVYNVTEPITPLCLSSERKTLKLFMSDVGLLSSLILTSANVYKLLDGEKEINFGAIYENAVAQELFAHGFNESLYYYNSKKSGEIDFVIEVDNDVIPIEIKSGKPDEFIYYNHKALDNILSIYHHSKAYVFGDCNINKENDIICEFPIYMIMFIEKR